MKKKLALALGTTIATVATATGVYAATDIKLFVNGKQATTDLQINDGSAYVPVRDIAGMLGAEVKWDEDTRTINVTGKELLSQQQKIVLEPLAQKFADDTANPPYLFDLGPEQGREVVDQVQSGDVKMPDADIENLIIPGGPKENVSLTIVRPKHTAGKNLPVVLYTHGAGWVFGNFSTHERLVRELAVGSGSAVVFTNYDLSPEAKYPVAIEEVYTTLEWIAQEGNKYGLDGQKITVAGDSVGGNMSAAVTLMAKDRNGPKISKQLLFYPVTDANFDTDSYHQFATGYFLRRDGMQWFWDQYTTDANERNEIYASPLRATTEQLKGLPEALVITAEADVLRDEGEAYANKLKEAGVTVTAVRFQGIIHDFVMLNALKDTNAAHGAMLLANSFLAQ